MSSNTSPVPSIGNWYQNKQDGSIFEVVAVDARDGTIEIQFFNGDITELDVESWVQMQLSYTAEPNDTSGALEPDTMNDDAEFNGDAVNLVLDQEFRSTEGYLDDMDL
ncbi:DUF6763 family protein [Pelagibaculum spongiae]|uniref:DUF6763 family protein n=1 Tax=Pelagibaculum spongiae TaxID=2080658 RepID=UPI0015AF35ED|nr:DUF6763 family protein [Pelagibaculum spongiae]